MTNNDEKFFDTGLVIGDKLVCIDDDSEDEDLGMSGIVLIGNRSLTMEKIYTISDFSFRHVPSNKRETWTPEEYKKVRLSWVMVELEGIKDLQWLKNFKKK